MGDDVIKDFEEDDDPNSEVGHLAGDSAGKILSILVTWIISFLAFLQTTFHLSDTITGIMLHFFNVLFNVLGQFCHVCAGVVQRLPKSYYQMKNISDFNRNPLDVMLFAESAIMFIFSTTVLTRLVQDKQASSALTELIPLILTIE